VEEWAEPASQAGQGLFAAGKKQRGTQGDDGMGGNHQLVPCGSMSRYGHEQRLVMYSGGVVSGMSGEQRRCNGCGSSHRQGVEAPMEPELPATYQPGQHRKRQPEAGQGGDGKHGYDAQGREDRQRGQLTASGEMSAGGQNEDE
jgi:hypothetical protein